MRKINLTLQYDGTDYYGWQVQKEEKTIQGLIENAVLTVTGENLRVTGASRTDAGVHAFEQVATFDTLSTLEPGIFLRALNANLPNDIRVIDSREVSEDFHPRYHARNKTYSYLITNELVNSIFLKRYSWQVHYHLNDSAMREAAGHIIGKHDFSSFRASGCGSKHPVREITGINISKLDSVEFITFKMNSPVIKISIQANAFLRHMVRNIVGTLLDAGREKYPPEKMKDIMEAKNRSAAGQTAPASGLFLEKIVY